MRRSTFVNFKPGLIRFEPGPCIDGNVLGKISRPARLRKPAEIKNKITVVDACLSMKGQGARNHGLDFPHIAKPEIVTQPSFCFLRKARLGQF